MKVDTKAMLRMLLRLKRCFDVDFHGDAQGTRRYQEKVLGEGSTRVKRSSQFWSLCIFEVEITEIEDLANRKMQCLGFVM